MWKAYNLILEIVEYLLRKKQREKKLFDTEFICFMVVGDLRY